MQTLELNGSNWQSREEFFDALAVALGSFEGHGRNADAFLETMIYYLNFNTVQPPYEVVVKHPNETVRPFLNDFASWVEQARAGRKSDPNWGDNVDVKVIIS